MADPTVPAHYSRCKLPYRRAPLAERFAEKFVKNAWTGCWEWIAARHKAGHGKFAVSSKDIQFAHRVSWMLHRGDIPDGMWVLHKCDNPRCVNPEHLYLGDHAQNTADMVSRGRANPPKHQGKQVSWAKLSVEAVMDIRTKRVSINEFAKIYGVGRATVHDAQSGKKWTFLPMPSPHATD